MLIKKCGFGLFFLVMLSVSWAADSQRFLRDVWYPKYHGQPLAYCDTKQQRCGKSIADEYCKMLGYAKANKIIKAYNVGLTHYIDVQARCKGYACDGYELIQCEQFFKRHPHAEYRYTKRHFVYPRFAGYRVDWCYDGEKACGYKVAQSYCRRLGFDKTIRYLLDENVSATKAIGNRKLCFGPGCRGFRVIDCQR